MPDPLHTRVNRGKGHTTTLFRFPSYIHAGLASNSASAITNERLRISALFLPRAVQVTELAVQTTVVGEAGSRLRAGIWDSNAELMPRDLLAEGLIPADLLGANSVAVDLLLTPGCYWLGGATQLAPTTVPQMKTISQSTPMYYDNAGFTFGVAGLLVSGFISGALPNPMGSNLNPTGNGVMVLLKVEQP